MLQYLSVAVVFHSLCLLFRKCMQGRFSYAQRGWSNHGVLLTLVFRLGLDKIGKGS
ncbi:unnamed protein product [Amoebophrya sp. A25]|nr:unnamed protein product [Amoebophrya sp. A25]|eukprot:GSA25T00000737001.1